MDFGFTPEQEALRRNVRAFSAEHMTPDVVREMEEQSEGFGVSRGVGRGPLVSELFRKIGEQGWLGISYPKEYGGQDGDRISQYVVEEEFARVNIAVGLGGSGAPAILAAGTEEQKQHFIPRLISGARGREGNLRAQPHGRLPVRHQPRQRPGHAGPGCTPRARPALGAPGRTVEEGPCTST